MKLKQLLEGDVVHLPKKQKATSDEEYHLGKMREHAQMAKVHDNLTMENHRAKYHAKDLGDEELYRLHDELATNHQGAALIHGAIKNHHYRKFKSARDAADKKLYDIANQDTSSLSGNAVRLK